MTTYLLVHGMAHGAWCWDLTVRDLRTRGHDVVAAARPVGPSTPSANVD
jgi:alpha-beta hydrolase superfamily lysophospholipase